MSLVNLLLFILGIVLIVGGVWRIAHRAYIDGVIVVVLGLILLAVGGFINA